MLRAFASTIRGGYSSEALAVFDRLPNPLTTNEKNGIATFVDTSVASGNWDKLDYFFGYFLEDSVNALIDWKTGLLSTAVNSPIHTPNEGYLFNGINQYINTNINLSTDLINSTLNNNYFEAYVYSNLSTDATMLYGAVTTSGTSKALQLYQTTDSIKYNLFDSNSGKFTTSYFQNRTRYAINRQTSAGKFLFINGTSAISSAIASTSIPSLNLFVGARNLRGAPANYFNGKVAYFYNGSGDVNQSHLTAALSQLEADLII